MKKFCEFLREHAIKIIDFKTEKSEVIKQQNSKNHEKMQKSVIFVMKNLKINVSEIKNTAKLEIIVIIQRNIEVLCIAYII